MSLSSNTDLLKLVSDYEMARSIRVQANEFIKLVEASEHKYSLSVKALKGLNKLKNCGQVQHRIMPNGFIKDYIIKCHHPCCHKCDDYDRIQVAFDILEKAEALFPDEKIIRNQISWVTINFSKADLGSDLDTIHIKAKSDINTLLKRKLPNVAFIGNFQIAIQQHRGMLHAHFIAVHPYNDRTEIEKTLREKFSRKTDVFVKGFCKDQPIDYAVYVAAWYSSDLTTKQKTYHEITPDIYAKYLNSLESIRSGGRRGYHFNPGYTRLLAFRTQLLKEEKERRLSTLFKNLALYRSRNTVPNDVDCCPKNSCIHSELSPPKFPSVSAMLDHYARRLKHIFFATKNPMVKAIKAVKRNSYNRARKPGFAHISNVNFFKRE